MPIYEYKCRVCGHEFETLVRASSTPNCPSCQSEDLERLLSVPAVTSAGIKKAALGAARKQLAQKQRRENIQRHEEERRHPHDH
jgi:putative FmdB family regulatory protein